MVGLLFNGLTGIERGLLAGLPLGFDLRAALFFFLLLAYGFFCGEACGFLLLGELLSEVGELCAHLSGLLFDGGTRGVCGVFAGLGFGFDLCAALLFFLLLTGGLLCGEAGIFLLLSELLSEVGELCTHLGGLLLYGGTCGALGLFAGGGLFSLAGAALFFFLLLACGFLGGESGVLLLLSELLAEVLELSAHLSGLLFDGGACGALGLLACGGLLGFAGAAGLLFLLLAYGLFGGESGVFLLLSELLSEVGELCAHLSGLFFDGGARGVCGVFAGLGLGLDLCSAGGFLLLAADGLLGG